MKIIKLLITALFFTIIASHASAKDIHCILKHSATARLDEKQNVDVHTAQDDGIEVTIQGIGNKEAIFNGKYTLSLKKKDANAFYYSQDIEDGFIMWTYFVKTNTLVYTKIRAFPGNQMPDCYLMIGKCD